MENPAGRSNDTTTASFWRRRSSRYSWEELAFAEDDAAGSFWPPRSYTCSFCRREFRSAQALGGHMNVHRRDRARLKQAEDHRNHDQSESKRAASCYTLVFSPNPKKSERSYVNFDLASSSSSPSATLSSRVLSLSRKEGISQETSLCPPSFYSSSSSFVLEHSKNVKKLLFESPILEEDKSGRIERDVSESVCRAKLGLDNTIDLSVSLNLVIQRSLPEAYGGGGKKGKIEKSCKRRRRDKSISQTFSNPSLSCENDIVNRSNEEIRQRANPLEDLDLELRLGVNPPKVNLSISSPEEISE